jgi:hypothetical protein
MVKEQSFVFWENFHHVAIKKRNCQSFKDLFGKNGIKLPYLEDFLL